MDVRRRTMTPSDQTLLATPDPAIRDFLKIPQDDVDVDDAVPRRRRDADGGGAVSNWKPLRDRLRLRRAANAWLRRSSSSSSTTARFKAGGGAATTTTTNSGGAGLGNNRSNKYIYAPGEATAAFSRAPSLRATTPTFSRVTSARVGPNSFLRSCSRRPPASFEIRSDDDHVDEDDSEEDDDDEKEEAPAAQMSLMALLEQTDSWDDDEEEEEDEERGGGGGARRMRNGGGDDEEDEEARVEEEEEMVHVCCVCMVRHKGAAFIPCGHTFCRLCSRELWVSRGNCPLCNGFIQEILDIF